MLKIYKFFQILSLDVALGGALISASIGVLLGVEMPVTIPLALGIAIWLIYTSDHLVDAHKAKKSPLIERHSFHRQYFIPLVTSVGILSLIGVGVVLMLPVKTLIYGAILFLLVLCYFAVILLFKSFYLKELIVAFVYAAGIFLGPVSMMDVPVPDSLLLLLAQLFLLALLNLLLFSLFEIELDKIDNHPSLARKLGPQKSDTLVGGLSVLLLALQVYFVIALRNHEQWLLFHWTFVCMHIILMILYWKKESCRKNSLFRMIGDGIFFLPGLYLLL